MDRDRFDVTKNRDAKRELGRCINEWTIPHPHPAARRDALGDVLFDVEVVDGVEYARPVFYSKCDPCRVVHRGSAGRRKAGIDAVG